MEKWNFRLEIWGIQLQRYFLTCLKTTIQHVEEEVSYWDILKISTNNTLKLTLDFCLVSFFWLLAITWLLCASTEIVRAMTYVINQGMAMYWGTSRWTAMEIMVSVSESLDTPTTNCFLSEDLWNLKTSWIFRWIILFSTNIVASKQHRVNCVQHQFVTELAGFF